MQKITPFLWFNNQAEEAMKFYISVFKNSKHVSITRYGKAGLGTKGTVMTARFLIEGQEFVSPWRPGIHVLTGDIVCRELQNAGRS